MRIELMNVIEEPLTNEIDSMRLLPTLEAVFAL
jgi:hypothetical protein